MNDDLLTAELEGEIPAGAAHRIRAIRNLASSLTDDEGRIDREEFEDSMRARGLRTAYEDEHLDIARDVTNGFHDDA